MHRPSKRIVAPLFLFLVAAVIFAPEVRGDGVPMVSFTFSDGTDSWSFTLPQNPVPDSVGTEDFRFIQVPVLISAPFEPPNTSLTYTVSFLRLQGITIFEMNCDPFIVSFTDPPFFICDFIPRTDVQGDTAIWSGALNNPTFIPGVYGGVNNTLTISETPEPSTLALLLIGFATLSLLALEVRPSQPKLSSRDWIS
jgi:hypothetical protein